MPKNIVICTDGTWNKPDQTDRGRVVPSNVVKINRALAKLDAEGKRQIAYYDAGVGTGGWFDTVLGGAFGKGLSKNLRQAYAELSLHYDDGDSIFLLGFSRGAYTARSLAGMIGQCGILNRPESELPNLVKEAFALYKRPQGTDKNDALKKFREEFAHESKDIKFVGVWDTVGALGIPRKFSNWRERKKYQFLDVKLGAHIQNAYHAIAIDERRKPFIPSLWDVKNLAEGQTVVQAWFPGVHSNLGGGYADTGLSDRALLWMILAAEDCGLVFDAEYIRRRIDPNYHGELRDSMSRVYKIFGPHVRQIGAESVAGEIIHFSAELRTKDETNQYKPENLLTALHLGKVDIPHPTKDEESSRR